MLTLHGSLPINEQPACASDRNFLKPATDTLQGVLEDTKQRNTVAENVADLLSAVHSRGSKCGL